jgi:phenylacetate-coenzyme A ligase PaaK-like adenylate-forming protein
MSGDRKGIVTGDPGVQLREFARRELAARLPDHLDRLAWDQTRLAAHQRDRLRALLAHAAANSPFHARRLAGIDATSFELGDMPRLPVMTNADLMREFDGVVTDRRLTLHRVQSHLDESRTRAGLLLGEYVCLATGGSSGVRAVFTQTVGEFMDYMASFMRPAVARSSAGGDSQRKIFIAVVAAPSPIHASGLATAAITAPVRLVAVPATLPVAEMVRRLNDLQPPVLAGYPTMLAMLAGEQAAGRLNIAPVAVTSSSEQLTDSDRAAITEAFCVPVTDLFCATEGLIGHTEPGGRVFTFATDMCVAELVTAEGKPVPPGATADKVLVTNLHNFTQPLIRYELTDRFTLQPDEQAGFLRATVEGRVVSVFRYRDVAVHPMAFATALRGDPAVIEYQVRQTERGAVIDVVADGLLDRTALADEIRGEVKRSGLREPEIDIRVVTSLHRHPDSGKALRFIPDVR